VVNPNVKVDLGVRIIRPILSHLKREHSNTLASSWYSIRLEHLQRMKDHYRLGIEFQADPCNLKWVDRDSGDPLSADYIIDVVNSVVSSSKQGRFVCNSKYCNAAIFDWAGYLAIHMLITHHNAMIQCIMECGETFTDMNKFRCHCSKEHPHLKVQSKRGMEIKCSNTMASFLQTHNIKLSDQAMAVKATLAKSPKKVFFIDVETTWRGQGAELLVLEASVINGTGRVVLNTLIDYGYTVTDFLEKYAPDPTNHPCSLVIIKVYGPERNEKINGLTPAQVVERLKTSGMGPESILVEWSSGCFDWNAIRRLMERTGDTTCLPLKRNNWMALQDWKRNMPGQVCKLESIFPLLFPGDVLLGQNHRSLPDTQMLVNMVLKLFEVAS
jgi:hypothetical protein